MIAILDDDALSAEALSFLLKDWGYESVVARNASDLEKHPKGESAFQMIIADYHLQDGRNGILEAAHLAEHLGRTMPTLIMSGSLGANSLTAATDRGFAYLPKPVNPDELQSVLTRMLFQVPPKG